MMGFYASIMFVGILLIMVSMIWIAYDKKKSLDDEKRINEKSGELLKIISDAELMVEELNRVSDYVVSAVEKKSKEAQNAVESIEAKVKGISQESNVLKKEHVFDSGRFQNGGGFVFSAEPSTTKSHRKADEKVILVNSKHKEVIAMAQKGFNETEIAKKLSMGKGEIQLILGVNK